MEEVLFLFPRQDRVPISTLLFVSSSFSLLSLAHSRWKVYLNIKIFKFYVLYQERFRFATIYYYSSSFFSWFLFSPWFLKVQGTVSRCEVSRFPSSTERRERIVFCLETVRRERQLSRWGLSDRSSTSHIPNAVEQETRLTRACLPWESY